MTTTDSSNIANRSTANNSAANNSTVRDRRDDDVATVRQPSDSGLPTSFRNQLPRRRPWLWLIAGLAVGAVGALAASAVFDAADDPNSGTGEQVTTTELATSTVATQNLIEEIEWDGTLGYGDNIDVTGGGGTVTGAVEVGRSVERGDTLLWVDQYPVTVFYGNVPAYRDLGIGDSGTDVQQLEANLVALGYDPDGTVTIDNDFTSYTAYMVERWQDDLGVDITGEVESASVVILPGPSVVRSMVDPGATANGVVASLAPVSNVTDVVTDGGYTSAEVQDLLSVSLVVDVSDADEFAIGDPITIEQVDKSELPGTVGEVGTEVTTAPDGVSTVEITIDVDAQAVAAGQTNLIEGVVVVKTVGASVTDALVVPSRALISLKEGGFAVEKVVGNTTELVGIEIGAFDDGLVEVVSVVQGTLTPGEEVVVPQ